MLVELNEENYDNETKNGLKLVEFYTTWCSYCKKQRIELMELEDSDMWVGLVDCEESPKLVLLKNGEKVAEFPGFHQKAQLLNKLMNYLA